MNIFGDVAQAMKVVKREDFLPPNARKYASVDAPLNIGFNQTNSQPATVLFMLNLLDVKPGDKILDVGSGSGWTTALLAWLTGERGSVVGVERVPKLVEFGRKNLTKYPYPWAKILKAEAGSLGYIPDAPYNKIMVSASAGDLPAELVDQLSPGGIMTIPVGNSVYKVTKDPDGKVYTREFPGFAFRLRNVYNSSMGFSPKYTITPKILDNIKKITQIKTELNYRRFPETVKMRFERLARDLSVYSSTSIEGNPLPLTEVKAVLKNRPEYARDTEKEVINYNDALEYLSKIIKMQDYSFDAAFILQVHGMVVKDLLQGAGDFRKAAVFVNNPKFGKTVYWPPDSGDIEELVKELLNYVNVNRGKIDAVILAGLFHKQFVIIHPFLDGNGRTARLLAKVLLANLGLNTFNLFSFENYYNQTVTKYFEQVGVLGDYYDVKDTTDFTSWLEYFTDGIVDELLRVQKELNKVDLNAEYGIKPYQRKILDYIKDHGSITDADYVGLTERANSTRALDFGVLVKMGLIKREGKGKLTRYILPAE